MAYRVFNFNPGPSTLPLAVMEKFPIYVMKLVLEWVKEQGGVEGVEKVNEQKKDLVYGMIDAHPEFFRGTVEKEARSWMNITLRLPDEELERKLISEAKA